MVDGLTTLQTKNLLTLSAGLITTVDAHPGFGELKADPASEQVSVADEVELRAGEIALLRGEMDVRGDVCTGGVLKLPRKCPVVVSTVSGFPKSSLILPLNLRMGESV